MKGLNKLAEAIGRALPERVLEAMFPDEAARGEFAAQYAKALRLCAEVQP